VRWSDVVAAAVVLLLTGVGYAAWRAMTGRLRGCEERLAACEERAWRMREAVAKDAWREPPTPMPPPRRTGATEEGDAS